MKFLRFRLKAFIKKQHSRTYVAFFILLNSILVSSIFFSETTPSHYQLPHASNAALGFSCSANPGTVNINGQIPEPSIQAAINSASNGDTVCVGAGTWPVNLSITNQYITLEGAAGAGQTVLVSANGGPVIVWQHVPYTYPGEVQAFLIGFTITGGYSSTATSGQAGGLTLANGADVQVQNVNITRNSTATYGGGVIVYNSSPVFANDEISYNIAAQGGGGMLIVNSSFPSIFQCGFDYNTATFGGGIWADSGSGPVIVESTFGNNQAVGEGGAIGERIGVQGVIQNNTFNGNVAAYGGALDLETAGNGPEVLYNAFTNNLAQVSSNYPGSGYGGAISAYNRTVALVKGNSFSSNQAAQGGGAVVVSENSGLVLENNQVYSNSITTSGAGEGGGLYVSAASATVEDNCFVSNVAGAGGAIVDELGGSLALSHNTLVNNQATVTSNGYPGGIRVRQNSSSFSSSYDLIANSAGTEIEIDGSPTGSYTHDDLYSASGGAIVEIAFSGYSSASSLPGYFTATISVSPVFLTTPNNQLGSCMTSNSTELGGAGVLPPYPSTLQPVYRFFSTVNHTHFFTQSMSERDAVLQIQPIGGFQYEAIAFWAYTAPASITVNSVTYTTVPVARYRENANPGIHFYSDSPQEQATLSPSVWTEETPNAFYVFPANTPGMIGVCRFSLIGTGDHFWTADPAECAALQTNPNFTSVWRYEGIAFSVPIGVD